MTTEMTIEQVMRQCPLALTPCHTLAEAHAIMGVHKIRHLPVEEAGKLVGIVSQGDLRLLESLEQLDTRQVEVEEAMTPDPYAVGPSEPLRRVVREMWARRIGCALVVEGDALVGIFTCVDALALLGQVLERPDAPDLGSPADAIETTGYAR